MVIYSDLETGLCMRVINWFDILLEDEPSYTVD